jgi:LuxR family transcriptional regulator, maltose regulon positive regulatory protein
LALARGAWEEARDAFAEALAEEKVASAFEGLGWAAWWLDDGATTLDARHEAFRLHRQCGDVRSAALVAVRLAEDYLTFRAEPAVSNGWLHRAERLLAGLEPGPEHGWLTLFKGHFALLLRADTAEARRRGAETAVLGRSLGALDLETLGIALEGLALVTEGHPAKGMARLDEAAAAATGGELSNLEAIIWTYCYLLFACERLRDYDRAGQWCDRAKEFAERYAMRMCFAVCRTHYAGLLMWRGAWEEAEAELTAGTDYLAARRRALAGEGVARLAELRTRQGRLEEAERLLTRVEGLPLALLGRAELALEQGDALGAAAFVERFIRNLPPENSVERTPALELLVRALVSQGDLRGACGAIRDLGVVANAIGTAPMRAAAREAEGRVAAATGEHDRARRLFEDAIDLYEPTGASFHSARAREELARSLVALDLREAASREAKSAAQTLHALGAEPEARRADGLLKVLRLLPAPSGLSGREVEVLRLVADGLGDKEIATRLVVSNRTVHAHLRSIYRKLEVRGRAAAARYAVENGLLV